MPLSIILPVKNEALALSALPAKLREHQPEAEPILVDDGSTRGAAGPSLCNSARKVYKHKNTHSRVNP